MKCTSNIADHDAIFAPAACIREDEHDIHEAANGATWIDTPARQERIEDIADELRIAELTAQLPRRHP